jgi:hypothetical protein
VRELLGSRILEEHREDPGDGVPVMTYEDGPEGPEERPHDFSFLRHEWGTFEADYETAEIALQDVVEILYGDIKRVMKLHPQVREGMEHVAAVASDAALGAGTGAIQAALLGQSLLLRESGGTSKKAVAKTRTAVAMAAGAYGMRAAFKAADTMFEAAFRAVSLTLRGPDPETAQRMIEALNAAKKTVDDIALAVEEETNILYSQAWNDSRTELERGDEDENPRQPNPGPNPG